MSNGKGLPELPRELKRYAVIMLAGVVVAAALSAVSLFSVTGGWYDSFSTFYFAGSAVALVAVLWGAVGILRKKR